MFCIILMSADVSFARLIYGLIELVLDCYPCIIALGTGNYNGHYCAETCRPNFTQLMTVRREGESVDYRGGIWSLSQYSLEICFFGFFNLWYLIVFGCVHKREAFVWFYGGLWNLCFWFFNIRIG